MIFLKDGILGIIFDKSHIKSSIAEISSKVPLQKSHQESNATGLTENIKIDSRVKGA